MRLIVASTAIILAFSPIAFAQDHPAYPPQSTPGSPSAPYGSNINNPVDTSNSADAGGSVDTGVVGAPANTQPDPDNCGTPDEPKACPPMPRHALRHYPANR